MLQRDLKRLANESVFNPNKPEKHIKILMDVGNPNYWVTKAIEELMRSRQLVESSTAYHECLKDAISLLLLTRTFLDEKVKKG